MSRPLPVPAEIRRATMSDGAEILLRRFAHPTGPRLAITHGNGFAVDGFRVFWEPLLADYDVVLFDMRGHGMNPPGVAANHHYPQLAEDVRTIRAAIAAGWDARPTVGVFHSMSSRAAMKQAVEDGWIWDALVLFDPPNVPLRGHPLYEKMRRFETRLVEFALNRQEEFASVAELVESYRNAPASKGWLPQAQEDMARAVLRDREGGGYELAFRRECEAAIYLEALTLDLWPHAREFGGPFIMICADPDMERPSPTAIPNRALAEEGGYDYAAVPGTGHLLQIEKPAECVAVMTDFLARHGLGPGGG